MESVRDSVTFHLKRCALHFYPANRPYGSVGDPGDPGDPDGPDDPGGSDGRGQPVYGRNILVSRLSGRNQALHRENKTRYEASGATGLVESFKDGYCEFSMKKL